MKIRRNRRKQGMTYGNTSFTLFEMIMLTTRCEQGWEGTPYAWQTGMCGLFHRIVCIDWYFLQSVHMGFTDFIRIPYTMVKENV